MSTRCRPRYAPRESYRTRPSALEVDRSVDFAATALDRAVVTAAELAAARAGRSERTPCVLGLPVGPSGRAFALVLGLATLGGIVLGTVLAFA